MTGDDKRPEFHACTQNGNSVERSVDLVAFRDAVEAADAFTLLPAELLQLLDRVRREMLAAIDAAERRGQADPTLVRLARAWPPANRKPEQP